LCWLVALHGDVAGCDLVLAGQRGEHLGVRGQQHRAERHRQLVRQPAQRRHEAVGDRRLVLDDVRHRIAGPPRDRGEAASDQHTAPKLPATIHSHFHRIFTSTHRCHGATPR
jgi:hypothetical protein